MTINFEALTTAVKALDTQAPDLSSVPDAQKDCVSRKIKVLRAEGKPQDEAVAIATSMCKSEAAKTIDFATFADVVKTIALPTEAVKSVALQAVQFDLLSLIAQKAGGAVETNEPEAEPEPAVEAVKSAVLSFKDYGLLDIDALGDEERAVYDRTYDKVFGLSNDPTKARLAAYGAVARLANGLAVKGRKTTLSYSSDSLLHHVQGGFNPLEGELQTWPMAGCSLTPTPAEPGLGPVVAEQQDDGSILIKGWAILFGDKMHRDLDKQWFGGNTDFFLEDYANAPLWWDHASDKSVRSLKLGNRSEAQVVSDYGIWMEHRISAEMPAFKVVSFDQMVTTLLGEQPEAEAA